MYDYVIAGAGSAGCVLAARLSADPNNRVLLLEAGGSDDDVRVRTPGFVGLLWRNKFDWTYFTEPLTEAASRKMHWPRGKLLGGSSSINYMIYIRGHRANYDQWRALGNAGWGYDDVLPYFKRAESNSRGASEFHGAEQVGVGRFQTTIRNGARCSTAVAYLRPALGRPNLTVHTDAMVARVDVENGRAVGVTYKRDGQLQSVRAEREVILCGGAIGSPHMLLLSGIGPAAQLRAQGIGVVADLPGVGENLQDHLIASVVHAEKAGHTGHVNPLNLLRWWGQYALRGDGPMSSNTAEAGGFVHTQSSAPQPDLQFHFLPVGSKQESSTRARSCRWAARSR